MDVRDIQDAWVYRQEKENSRVWLPLCQPVHHSKIKRDRCPSVGRCVSAPPVPLSWQVTSGVQRIEVG